MKPPTWVLRYCSDLSGCWIEWVSPVGIIEIERQEPSYLASLSLYDPDADISIGKFATLKEAQAGAVAFVRREARRLLREADRLRRMMLA